MMKSNRALTYEQVLWSYKHFKMGYTMRELGEILFVTPKTIQRSFDRYGLKRSHKSGRRRLEGRIIEHFERKESEETWSDK